MPADVPVVAVRPREGPGAERFAWPQDFGCAARVLRALTTIDRLQGFKSSNQVAAPQGQRPDLCCLPRWGADICGRSSPKLMAAALLRLENAHGRLQGGQHRGCQSCR